MSVEISLQSLKAYFCNIIFLKYIRRNEYYYLYSINLVVYSQNIFRFQFLLFVFLIPPASIPF